MTYHINSSNKSTIEVSYEYIKDCYFQYKKKCIENDENIKPFIVFVSAPQGSGKTYLTTKLTEKLNSEIEDSKSLQVSIDDFYLKHEDQVHINNTIGVKNPLVCGRGLPLTHDLPLLSEFINTLFSTDPNTTLEIPRYDKSKFNGEGDRLNTPETVDFPIDIILFEGWFLGYTSADGSNSQLLGENNNMKIINKELAKYSDILWGNPLIKHAENSCGVIIKSVPTLNIGDLVLKWRLQQEHDLISKSNGQGMSDKEVEKFVQRYLPMYKLYYDNLNHMGTLNDLFLEIDETRKLISYEYRA